MPEAAERLPQLPVRGSLSSPQVVDSGGVLVDLAEAPDELLASARETLDGFRDRTSDARSVVTAELLRRMGKERSMPAGPFLAEQTVKREWDERATWQALGRLVELEVISSARVDEVMPEKTIRKPDGRKLNALLGEVVGQIPDLSNDAVMAVSDLSRARGEKPSVSIHRVAVDADATEVTS